MPTNAQRDCIEGAIGQIQNTESELLGASLASSDPIELGKIKAQFDYLDSLLKQLVHTRLINDDAIFAQATATIKQTASHLAEQAASIGKVTSAVAKAGKIAGYLAQAATFLAGL